MAFQLALVFIVNNRFEQPLGEPLAHRGFVGIGTGNLAELTVFAVDGNREPTGLVWR